MLSHQDASLFSCTTLFLSVSAGSEEGCDSGGAATAAPLDASFNLLLWLLPVLFWLAALTEEREGDAARPAAAGVSGEASTFGAAVGGTAGAGDAAAPTTTAL